MKTSMVGVAVCAAMMMMMVALVVSQEILEPEEALLLAERDPLQYGCTGDLGLVYASSKLSKLPPTGCGYAQYNPKTCNGTLNLVKCVSSICADDKGGVGRSAVAYNRAKRIEYFHTGTGANVWAIVPTNGAQTPFAALPADHSDLIGLELLGSILYLVTIKEYYTAQTNNSFSTKMATFSPPTDLPADLLLSPNSLVSSNGVDTLYFINRVRSVVAYNPTTTESIVQPLVGVSVPRFQQLFWTKEAGLVLAANDNLYRLNNTNNLGEATLVGELPVGARGATMVTTNYWVATNTTMNQFDVVTGKRILSKKIAGEPIIGNFVYIS